MRIAPRVCGAAMFVCFGWLLLAGAARAADFYSGKNVDFVVASEAGGGYDLYARAIARHLFRFIPGAPNIVVQNMPGAGGAKAAAYLDSVAAKDGTVIGSILPGTIMLPLLGDTSQTLYNPAHFAYLGSANSGVRVCVTSDASPIRTFDDALKKTAVLGANMTGGATRDYAYLLQHTTDAQFKIVSGYPSIPAIMLAVERGEVDGMCGWDWASLKSQKGQEVKDGKLRVILQLGIESYPELTRMGVPNASQYLKGPDDEKIVELVATLQQLFGRPYIAPPGTPAERVDILRAAFTATLADPGFLDDAKRAGIDIEPSSGSKVQEAVQMLYATPQTIIERARAAVRD
jgi:tripartite-type tricarboxylate transporter receptor subunit TctC